MRVFCLCVWQQQRIQNDISAAFFTVVLSCFLDDTPTLVLFLFLCLLFLSLLLLLRVVGVTEHGGKVTPDSGHQDGSSKTGL